MRKAQVETITIVLIAGIVISLAGAAYFWGRPVIEKRSTLADISNAKSFIVQLDKEIVETAKSGGTRALSIPKIPGSRLSVNTSGNEILFRFVTTQAMLDMSAGKASVPVETLDSAEIGEYGGSPRIITLEAEKSEQQYLMTIRLKYRELNTGGASPRGYMIVIEDGGSVAQDSPGAVSVFFSGTELESRGGTLGDRTKTKIRVTLS